MGMSLKEPIFPTDKDSAIATEASRHLASLIPNLGEEANITLEETGEQLVLPILAVHLLMDILEQMANGKPVSIIPTHAELTTQQAASVLNVSRPYLIKLIDQGELECRKVGTHRRILFEDLKKFKAQTNQAREKALEELALLSQEEDMGY